MFHEVAFDASALRGEVRHVGRAFEDCAFREAQIDPRFEEEGSGDENTFGDHHGTPAFGGKLIDSSLDGLCVQGGVVGDCSRVGAAKDLEAIAHRGAEATSELKRRRE